MNYLILHNFWSFGRYLRKGEVVDEAEIRSPRLRRSEGKIVPAVSSSVGSEGQGIAAPDPQVPATNEGDQNTPKAAPTAPHHKLSFGSK